MESKSDAPKAVAANLYFEEVGFRRAEDLLAVSQTGLAPVLACGDPRLAPAHGANLGHARIISVGNLCAAGSDLQKRGEKV